MSAFPNTGHWEVAELENLNGCFRPEAAVQSISGTPILAKMAATPQEGVKMRNGLLLLFWICVLSVVVRVPLLCYELWLLATGVGFSELTGWALLTDHLPFLSWFADLITTVLGAEFGSSLLTLPATLMTILKLIFGTVIGIWALDRVREMDSSHDSGRDVQSPG